MGTRDALTNLWNRETLDDDLPTAVESAFNTSLPLSCVMVDIDHFKKVNDTHGHAAGDSVLKEVAIVMSSGVQMKGQAYRYGGEEITILLPNHSTDEATAVAERARATLEGRENNGIKVTASFGVATLPVHANDGISLLKAADAALYDAKNRGRNLVRVSGEPDPPPSGERARKPQRRAPVPGGLPASQKQFMRENYFLGEQLRCPKDLMPLRVEELSGIGSPLIDLVVTCPVCGWGEHLSAEEE